MVAIGLPTDDLGQRVDRRRYRLIVMTGLNPGAHYFVDHAESDHVGDHGLESVADLDPHLAILGHDEDRQAVIQALAAHFPFGKGVDGPVVDGVIARRGAI